MSRRQRSSQRRDREHLARIFGAIVLATTPGALVLQACDSVSGSAPLDLDGAASNDSAAALDAASADADAASVADAGPACTITATYFDSGIYYDGGDGAVDVGCIYDLPCGLPPTLQAVGCTLYLKQTDSFDAQIPAGCFIPEGSGCTGGSYTPGVGGAVGVVCTDCLGGGGRRPRGLERATVRAARTPLGAYFAQMAHEEGASVFAFRRMKRELLRFAAPTALVRSAQRATREEMRHADVMQMLASRAGASAAPVRVRRARDRSLEAMALENAIEGCVNETFGALLMTWQAQHAPTAALRKTFARIARDETGHAVLAQRVAAWADSRLDDRARARVSRARERALRRLVQSANRLQNKAFEAIVGWPTAAQRGELARRMMGALAASSG